jgi:hypothetical protein
MPHFLGIVSLYKQLKPHNFTHQSTMDILCQAMEAIEVQSNKNLIMLAHISDHHNTRAREQMETQLQKLHSELMSLKQENQDLMVRNALANCAISYQQAQLRSVTAKLVEAELEIERERSEYINFLEC